MKVKELSLKGVLLFEPNVFKDERGCFVEAYNQFSYEKFGVDVAFVQDNLSISNKNVIRGLHFQHPPNYQHKLISVVKGAVRDVIVDLRKESSTYGKHLVIELDEHKKKYLYLPFGFAHGFLALEDKTIFSYKCSDVYHPESEDALLWNDSDLNISWGCNNPIVSKKDKAAGMFKEFKSPF